MRKKVKSWKNVPRKLEDYQGFVYIITCKKKPYKYYIGKKNFWKTIRRKPLKGAKRIRKDIVESDWRTYWGSSKKFQKYVEEVGKENFERNIIFHCKTKSEMSYLELIEQIEHDVLNDPNSFNGILHVRINRTK